jgi:hypothetical protein
VLVVALFELLHILVKGPDVVVGRLQSVGDLFERRRAGAYLPDLGFLRRIAGKELTKMGGRKQEPR